MNNKKYPFLSFPFLFSFFLMVITGLMVIHRSSLAKTNELSHNWVDDINQSWAGSEFWANRLQDWQVSNGRLKCLEPELPMRTVHLLTRELSEEPYSFEMSVTLGQISERHSGTDSWGGFLIGAGAGQLDYRAAALVHHQDGLNAGIIAAVDGEGYLVIRDMEKTGFPVIKRSHHSFGSYKNINELRLVVKGRPSNHSGYTLILQLLDAQTEELHVQLSFEEIKSNRMQGNIALVSHPGESQVRYWFDQLNVSGDKLEVHSDRDLGPIIGAQYTVSKNVLNLSAQLAPVDLSIAGEVWLEIIKPGSDQWQLIQKQKIDSRGWIAAFQVSNWNYDQKIPYRIKMTSHVSKDGEKTYYRQGMIAPNNDWKESIKIAGLSCQTLTSNNPRGFLDNMDQTWGGVDREGVEWSHNYIWFPHHDMVDNLQNQSVDFYAFLGDQIYEGGSPTQPDRRGGIKSKLDYLYKWYLWYWAFGDLLRDTPSITILDDHDVYQGNIWGEGGRPVPEGDINRGGYIMSPEFVNLVHYTQTSHLPDPYDPTPIKQDIMVYYTEYNLGGVSFAILEDRKFKSAPNTPEKEAVLLGERQKKFLIEWVRDWEDAWMKTVLTQTLFASLHTRGINQKGEYSADRDTNGWPPSKRDSVLKILRKGFAFVIGGDQHLSSVVHHGVDEWNDAGYSFIVPAISNFFERFWLPEEPGKNRKSGAPYYTGEYLDAFDNYITVHAVANPGDSGMEPSALHDKAPGYSIVKFDKASREITMETWPRYAQEETEIYDGWPVTIHQQDNYGREAAAYLPEIIISNSQDPVIEVRKNSNDELLYTIRIEGNKFRPKVFDTKELYTITVSFPEKKVSKILEDVKPGTVESTIEIEM